MTIRLSVKNEDATRAVEVHGLFFQKEKHAPDKIYLDTLGPGETREYNVWHLRDLVFSEMDLASRTEP